MTMRVGLSLVVVLAGCRPVLGDQTVVRPGTALEPAIAAYETARELKDQRSTRQALGWKLEVAAGRARYFACASVETCGSRSVDIDASAILAVKRVGRVTPTLDDGSVGDESEVYELTLKVDEPVTRGGAAYDPHRGLTVR